MYTFKIKDNTPDISILVTRCLLVLAAIGAFVYRSNQPFFINIIVALILLFTGITTKVLIRKIKLKEVVILIIGCFLLLVATHSIILSAIMLLIETIVKKLYRKPEIRINSTGIIINKMLSNKLHPWDEFNNIILKDNLLTLDFNDNKLWQLNIEEDGSRVEEESFNDFCSFNISH